MTVVIRVNDGRHTPNIPKRKDVDALPRTFNDAGQENYALLEDEV